MDHNVSYEEMIQLTKKFQLKLGVFKLQQKVTQQCSDDHFVSFTKLLKDLQSDINGLLLALTENKLHTKEDVVERRNRNQRKNTFLYIDDKSFFKCKPPRCFKTEL